jgi:uncharacterized protein YbaA (DUF1428 family)
MPRYVDGFVLAVPTKKMKAYKALAKKAGKIWMEYGALQYVEATGEDMKVKMGVSFPKLAGSKKNETVVFAFIVYRSRRHRDQVNAKVMQDERLQCMDPSMMPFDCNKMTYGGFDILVDLAKGE